MQERGPAIQNKQKPMKLLGWALASKKTLLVAAGLGAAGAYAASARPASSDGEEALDARQNLEVRRPTEERCPAQRRLHRP